MDDLPTIDPRAHRYAMATWRLRHDPEADGPEALFDQALTNGLAAIVAHDFPDELHRADGKIKSAMGLLDVLEAHGIPGPDGNVRLPHGSPGELWVTTLIDEKPSPNFTEIRLPVLRAAITRTQPVRHARDGAPDLPLTDEELAALEELDFHDALFALSDVARDSDELRTDRHDADEFARAQAYVELLDSDEWQRRRAIDYAAVYGAAHPDEQREVQLCPACDLVALVAEQFDSYLNEVGVGTCMACSYIRTQDVADQEGLSELIWRQSQSDE
jgi:hypothetical protein